MIDNEYADYILKEYPAWKVKSIFQIGVDRFLEGDDPIEVKVNDYEMFFDIPVEQGILFNIVNKISLNYKISNDVIYHLKNFVCDYLSICIPSFGRKWVEFKKGRILPISIEEFD